MEQNQIMQIQMMEQEANQYNEQLQIIDQNITEMQNLELSLEELKNSKSDDLLVDIGKRIYLPVTIKEKMLTVEVGKGKYVTKSIQDAQKILTDQLGKLNEAKSQVIEKTEMLQSKMTELMQTIQQ